MKTLSAAGMSGALKMSCVLALVNDGLNKVAPAVPVPSWLRLAQGLVARLVVQLLGSVFAGALEAIYQETIRKSDPDLK